MLKDCTSSASISFPKLGERLSWSGTPSTTNCVWYSEPRGCSTALPSYNHPGCEFTRSCNDRPGNELSRCSIVSEPIWLTAPGWSGSINVSAALTVTDCFNDGNFN